MIRVVLMVAVLAISYWCLGTFSFLRAKGIGGTTRWVLAVAMALWLGGVVQPLR